MWKFIVKRLLLGGVTVVIITFVVYALIFPFISQEYATLINRPGQSVAARNQIIARFGADQPFLLQYGTFLKSVTRPLWSWWGFPPHLPQAPDLGYSIHFTDQVSSLISQRIGPTFLLMGSAYLFTLIIAIPIGIISAVRQHSKLDNTVTSLSFLGISLPNFWFGQLLIFGLAIFPYSHGYGRIFPAGDIHDQDTTSIINIAWHLFLPMIVLAVQYIAIYSRFMRSAMLDVLSQDYIRTARAKGLSEGRVVIRHAFRNSLLPLITLMGIDIPQLFVGAIITENVFNWPGMGQLFVTAALAPDHSTLLGVVVVLSILVVLGNLLADVVYVRADPRISYEGAR